MTLEKRINAFVTLGERLKNLPPTHLEELSNKVANENPWFTPQNVKMALTGISKFLEQEKLEHWIQNYSLNDSTSKKVGVVMAGNIPLVGFHDLLCVLLAGHQLMAKVSSQDSVLMNFIKDNLLSIDKDFFTKLFFAERLNGVDAVIATGSDNTSRYFEYYFRSIPHIIRKNRTSAAIVVGEESSDELKLLGNDIFSYFGFGCRNVSKIYVPENFDFVTMLKSWESFQSIIHHHKYANNYDYQKSILLINQTHFYDSGFLLLTENKNLVSPIAVLHYEFYRDQQDLKNKLNAHAEKIQCLVSANGWFSGSIPFGKAQFPEVNDYADGVDTIAFLKTI